jgi:hypothetical protein
MVRSKTGKFGIAILLLSMLSGCVSVPSANSNGPVVVVADDEQACQIMSDAISTVNAEGYKSVADISPENNVLSVIPRSAANAGGLGAYEESGTGASDPVLISSLTNLWENWTFGSELINAQTGPEDHDPAAALHASMDDFQLVSAACNELGFALSHSALELTIPNVPEQAVEPTDDLEKDDEYSDFGTGVEFRFVDGQCDLLKCSHVELLAYQNCPNNVYIEGNALDSNGVIYGIVNDVLGAMKTGDRAIATLTITDKEATVVRVTGIDCY